jgi:hypothetical protein
MKGVLRAGEGPRVAERSVRGNLFFEQNVVTPVGIDFCGNAPNGNWFAEKPARRYCRRYAGYVRSCHRFVRRREL